jgi:hypothetical protein
VTTTPPSREDLRRRSCRAAVAVPGWPTGGEVLTTKKKHEETCGKNRPPGGGSVPGRPWDSVLPSQLSGRIRTGGGSSSFAVLRSGGGREDGDGCCHPPRRRPQWSQLQHLMLPLTNPHDFVVCPLARLVLLVVVVWQGCCCSCFHDDARRRRLRRRRRRRRCSQSPSCVSAAEGCAHPSRRRVGRRSSGRDDWVVAPFPPPRRRGDA